eukprot:1642_1
MALDAKYKEEEKDQPNEQLIADLDEAIRAVDAAFEPASDGGDSDEDGTEGGDADDSNGRYEIEDALESLEAWDVSVDDIKTAKDALANGLKLAKAALAKEEDKKPIWRQDEQLIADLEKAIKDAEDASVQGEAEVSDVADEGEAEVSDVADEGEAEVSDVADEGEAEVSDVADEGEAEVSDTEDKVISEDETPVEQEVDSNTGVQGVITNVGE